MALEGMVTIEALPVSFPLDQEPGPEGRTRDTPGQEALSNYGQCACESGYTCVGQSSCFNPSVKCIVL